MYKSSVEIDIPCDPQQMGEHAMPFALLSEARDPSQIEVGAIVITADEEDPVFAKVYAITQRETGPVVVHLELLPGDPLDYADALRRARLLPHNVGRNAARRTTGEVFVAVSSIPGQSAHRSVARL